MVTNTSNKQNPGQKSNMEVLSEIGWQKITSLDIFLLKITLASSENIRHLKNVAKYTYKSNVN